VDELKDPKCKDQVRKLTKRAAEDIRFYKPLADACYLVSAPPTWPQLPPLPLPL